MKKLIWMLVAAVAMGAAPLAPSPAFAEANEEVAFKDIRLFEFPEPSQWERDIKSTRVEWECELEEGCIVIMDFTPTGNLEYLCTEGTEVAMTQGQFLLPGSCAFQGF